MSFVAAPGAVHPLIRDFVVPILKENSERGAAAVPGAHSINIPVGIGRQVKRHANAALEVLKFSDRLVEHGDKDIGERRQFQGLAARDSQGDCPPGEFG